MGQKDSQTNSDSHVSLAESKDDVAQTSAGHGTSIMPVLHDDDLESGGQCFGVHQRQQKAAAPLHTFRCKQDLLDWNYRQILLDRELMQYNPDLLCLQEVNS